MIDVHPKIPDKGFYQDNNLLPLKCPEALYEPQKITTSKDRPKDKLSILEKFPEKLGREYHQVSLGNTTWLYVVDTFSKEPVNRRIQDLMIIDKNNGTKSIHEIMNALGIDILLMTGIDPHNDAESWDDYSADINIENRVGHVSIPIPRTAQDVFATLHELAHTVLDIKLIDQNNVTSVDYYLGSDFLTQHEEWKNLYDSIKSRYQMSKSEEEKQILKESGKRILLEYRSSDFYKTSKLREARLEFDTWFVAIQMTSIFGLDEFMKRHSKEIPEMINYYAFSSRLRQQ